MPELTPTEVEILNLEKVRYDFPGTKEQVIRDRFDMSAARYFQVLNSIIERPEALAHDPILVRRLLRLRDSRQRTRMSRRPRAGIDA